jgi:hypothetical protein
MLALAQASAATGDGVAAGKECAAYYHHISGLMEMSSSTKNGSADPAYLAKTAQSIATYRDRARELMVKAGRIDAGAETLPQDVLDREEALFSDLMNQRSDMKTVAAIVARCNAAHGFSDIQ